MEKHYICLGGCKGVSKVPGVCQAPDCANHNHELVECNCLDGLHNGFQQNFEKKKTGLGTVYFFVGILSLIYFFIFSLQDVQFAPFNFALLFFGLLMILKSVVSRHNTSKISRILLNMGIGISVLMSLLFLVLLVLAFYAIFSLFGVF